MSTDPTQTRAPPAHALGRIGRLADDLRHAARMVNEVLRNTESGCPMRYAPIAGIYARMLDVPAGLGQATYRKILEAMKTAG